MSGDANGKKAQLTRKTVEHLATLSALSLTPDEAEKMVRELGAIVDFIAELDELDTTDVPATNGVRAAMASVWRRDEVVEGVSHDEALAQAPRANGEGFLVPTFVDATGAGGTTGSSGSTSGGAA